MSFGIALFLVTYILIATLGGAITVYNIVTGRGPEREDMVHWIRLGLLFVPVVQGMIFGQQLAYLMYHKPRPPQG